MKVLALDLSLNGTGMAWGTYDDEKNKVTHIKTDIIKTKKIKDHMKKICYIKKIIGRKNKEFAPNKILIEGQSYGSRGRATLSIAQLHGVIMYACLKQWQVEYHTIPPTVVKKFITGKGNSRKSMILKSLYKRFHIDVDDEDKADAIGVLLTGAAMKEVWNIHTVKIGRKKS